MNDDVAREKLVGKLVRSGVWPLAVAERSADALLPVVREIAAEELREAADELVKDGRPDLTTVDQVNAVNAAADTLGDRADALHPGQPT